MKKISLNITQIVYQSFNCIAYVLTKNRCFCNVNIDCWIEVMFDYNIQSAKIEIAALYNTRIIKKIYTGIIV